MLTDLETGRRHLQLKPVALEPWLTDWLQQQQLPEGAELRLVAESASDALVALDAEAMKEVLSQLLDNSLRYSQTSAQIVVRLVAAERKVSLHWQDHGLGIHSAPREQVFDRFVRLEEHRDRNQADGAGLGLALCDALMQAMGGSIALAPQPAGFAGVIFELSWPQA